MKFSTKGDTLASLASVLKTARVIDSLIIQHGRWTSDCKGILEQIRDLGWQNEALIIRSSSSFEDTADTSLAGHFTSVLNVIGESEIIAAIEQVFVSYGHAFSENEQVLIQPMLKNVKMSGVVTSRDISNGSDYIVINYDESGDTNAATSGNTASLKTYYFFKYHETPAGILGKIIALVKELEVLFQTDSIDAEFGVDKDDGLYLFQVRPLCVKHTPSIDQQTHINALKDIFEKIRCLNKRHPFLYGYKTIFGTMPDWNPAEIIGIKPNPLALSLYKNVITDNIWAYQRNNYGYKNLRGFPIMVSLKGIPYIDARVCFNSFLPGDLDDDICEKLVDHYIDDLIATPSNHDKIEFEIVFSCYTFITEECIHALDSNIFSDDDKTKMIMSLKNLTNNIIDFDTGIWKKDIEKISILEQRRESILASEVELEEKIYWLLEDCKRYGTLPFAGLARAAFIAVEILKSLVAVDVITDEEYRNFMGSLNTVSKTMIKDFKALRLESFIEKYGHLRPGTYNILSPRYDEAFDKYFNASSLDSRDGKDCSKFVLSLEQYRAIQDLLKERGLKYDVLELFEFIKTVIEGREYSKYIFTKSISDVLLLFKQLCENFGFTVEESAYANIEIINEIYSSAVHVENLIKDSINNGKKKVIETMAIHLPTLIIEPEEVYMFHLMEAEPNYITFEKTSGEIAVLDNMDSYDSLNGRIVLISSADPGYDWIFSKGIKGLVTKYGGANSHMAIRSAELFLPAIIGCGEKLYNSLLSADAIEIDCMNKSVRVLR